MLSIFANVPSSFIIRCRSGVTPPKVEVKNEPYGINGVKPKMPPTTASVLRKFLRSFTTGVDSGLTTFSEEESTDVCL